MCRLISRPPREKPMDVLREPFRLAFGILAVSSFSMAAIVRTAHGCRGRAAAAPAHSAARTRCWPARFWPAWPLLALFLPPIYREKAHRLAKQALRQGARLDVLLTIESNFRALASLEPQAFVIWTDGHPRLALHTLPGTLGVPAKLPCFLRFGTWLHPDDAAKNRRKPEPAAKPRRVLRRRMRARSKAM